MKPSLFGNLTNNPFLIWSELAMKTNEMLFASAQVIGHRTGRMIQAGPNPNARDQREFTRMGQEKVDAAGESGHAMFVDMMRMNHQLGALALKQMLAGASAMTSLSMSRSTSQSMQGQAKLIHDTMAHSAAAAAQLSNSMARLANRGLAPIHSRATGNAKRLGKG